MSTSEFFHGKGAARVYRSQKPVEERTEDGIVFGSVAEMLAYRLIKPEVGDGWLTLQPKFLLLPKCRIITRGQAENCRVMTWSADFMIGPPRPETWSPVDDRYLIIDIKGMPSPVFKHSLRLFKWSYRHLPLIQEFRTKAQKLALLAVVREHVRVYGYG